MATINLTESAFEDKVKAQGIVLVDFWAAWCGPCRMFAPVFEKASQTHADIVFAKVDTEAEQRLSAGAGIRSIPTLMAFRDGILLFNQAGALPAPALEQLIGKLREVDMDQVRAEIAAQQATGRPRPDPVVSRTETELDSDGPGGTDSWAVRLSDEVRPRSRDVARQSTTGDLSPNVARPSSPRGTVRRFSRSTP